MMIIISLLVASTLISLTKSSPLSYQKRGLNDDNDQLYLPYLIDDHILSTNKDNWPQISKESMANIKNIKTSVGRMKKRIGSLSVVNSFDVLRERMLLELARRKVMQDQKQIDANRRVLDSVGKRSIQKNNDMNYSKYIEYDKQFDNQFINNQVKNYNPTNNPIERTIDWLNVDDADEHNDYNDQSSKMEMNELRIL